MATARRIRLQAEKVGAPYDALLLLGDIVYETGDADLTKRSVLDPFGSVAKGSDLIPVLGNHDVKSDEQNSILRQLGRTTSWYVQRVGPVQGDRPQLHPDPQPRTDQVAARRPC